MRRKSIVIYTKASPEKRPEDWEKILNEITEAMVEESIPSGLKPYADHWINGSSYIAYRNDKDDKFEYISQEKLKEKEYNPNNSKDIYKNIEVKVKQQPPRQEANPLIAAAIKNDFDEVKKLIEQKFDLNLEENGKTALIHAVRTGNEKIVKLLIDADAYPDLQDNQCWTALIHAIRADNENIVQMLLRSGSKPDIQDNQGRTALIHAVRAGKENIVKMLIDAGANKKDIKKALSTTEKESVRRTLRRALKQLRYKNHTTVSVHIHTKKSTEKYVSEKLENSQSHENQSVTDSKQINNLEGFERLHKTRINEKGVFGPNGTLTSENKKAKLEQQNKTQKGVSSLSNY